jgi:hypothetical protein
MENLVDGQHLVNRESRVVGRSTTTNYQLPTTNH